MTPPHTPGLPSCSYIIWMAVAVALYIPGCVLTVWGINDTVQALNMLYSSSVWEELRKVSVWGGISCLLLPATACHVALHKCMGELRKVIVCGGYLLPATACYCLPCAEELRKVSVYGGHLLPPCLSAGLPACYCLPCCQGWWLFACLPVRPPPSTSALC